MKIKKNYFNIFNSESDFYVVLVSISYTLFVCVFVCFIQMGPNCFAYLFCNDFIIKIHNKGSNLKVRSRLKVLNNKWDK